MLASLALIAALASGSAAAEEGVLQVEVDPGVEVQLFRTVQPGRGHMMVRRCEEDLESLLDGRRTDGILELDVMGVGDRSWYFRVQLDDDDLELDARVEEGQLLITTQPRLPASGQLELLSVTVDQLLEGTDLPEIGQPPALPMTFLHGQALLPAVDPASYQPLLPVYAPGVGPGSWGAIDRARQTYLESNSQRERAHAVYALGWNYLELGFTREARYYFDLLPSFEQAFDDEVIAMTRARVAIILGEWAEAREHLIAGWNAGASPEQVLESLALVSLATADPPATATAHALLSATGRPEAWLLAAELLQRDNHFEQSIIVLQGLESRVHPDYRPWVSLRLGDALLATQDLDGAARAYGRSPEDIAALRKLHTKLLALPSNSWPRVITPLREMATGDGVQAA